MEMVNVVTEMSLSQISTLVFCIFSVKYQILNIETTGFNLTIFGFSKIIPS